MKVIKNYLYNAGYQILNMVLPLITVPYISRVLGAHDVGINEYTNSWVTFFFLMVTGKSPTTGTTSMNGQEFSGE